MKLKLSFLSVLLFICWVNLTGAQTLRLGRSLQPSVNSKHMALESNRGDSLLYYQGYAVIFSYYYHLPRYTFHLLTVDQLTVDSTRFVVKRSNTFYPDLLPNGTLSATNIDYSRSGYDRGHMVPAGDFVWDKTLKDETFYYTNINPQLPNLNRGIWANLEVLVRNKVLQYHEDAYVVTGAVFNDARAETIGPRALCVPVVFFKLIYFQKANKMFAFLFDNTIDEYAGNPSDFQVSVDFIERITGEDFFDLLDDALEANIESKIVDFND